MSLAEYFIYFLFLSLGSLTVLAALLNFDWFFQTASATPFVGWLGRRGARLFYGVLGVVMIVCGVMGLLGPSNV